MPELPRSSKRILLAEDDPFISRMYETKLAASGFDIEVIPNGSDVLARLRQQLPDLAMIDIHLPELSGFEILARLEAECLNLGAMKLVILTNSSRQEDQRLAAHYGATYLIKADYTPRTILEKITKLLGGDK